MDEILKSSIDEVHSHVVKCADQIVNTLVEDRRIDGAHSKEFILFCKQLLKLVPTVSQPPWLHEVIKKFDRKQIATNYNPNIAPAFAKFLLLNFNEIRKPILTPNEIDFDFDLAFEQARDKQAIPRIFESLVVKLEKIIAADVIDSRVVQQALERLKTLLKRNKRGSLTSILVSIHYGRFVMKAFTGTLSASKHLKPMVDAFKEEFEEAETKVQNAETTLKEQAVRRLVNEERLKAYLEGTSEGTNSVAGYITFEDAQTDSAEQ